MLSPIARRPNTVASTTSASAPLARSMSIVRRKAELSNTIVSCGSQASRPPRPDRYAAADLGDIGRRAIDLLAGLRRHRRRGAVADMDRPVEAVSTGQPACRVDQHGLQRVADGAWHPDLGGALLVETVDARPAGADRPRRVRRAPRRAVRAMPPRIAVRAAYSRPLPSCVSGQRPGFHALPRGLRLLLRRDLVSIQRNAGLAGQAARRVPLDDLGPGHRDLIRM